MEITEGILNEYRELTAGYVTVSQQLRELLHRLPLRSPHPLAARIIGAGGGQLRCVSACQRHLLLRQIVDELSKAGKLPEPRVLKQLLRDFDKTEEEIEATLARFRRVRHRLLGLI